MIRKLLTIAVTIFIFIGCESKEEREIQKFLSNIVNTYNKKDYKETFAMIEDFESKYPDSKRIEELKPIKEAVSAELENLKYEEIVDLFNRGALQQAEYDAGIFFKEYPNSDKKQKLLEMKEISKQKKEELKKAQEEQEKQMVSLKQKIYTDYDEFDRIKWFYAKDDKGNRTSHLERIGIYGAALDKEGKKPEWLRLRFFYTGDDWIFFENVIVLVDDVKYEFKLKRYNAKTDVESGDVYERYDILVESAEMAMLQAIAKGRGVKVRFVGKYVYDFNLKESEKQKIKNMIEFYNMQI